MHKTSLLISLRCCSTAVLLQLGLAQPSFADQPSVAPAEAQASPVLSIEDLKGRAKEIKELEVEGDASLVGAPGPVVVQFKGSDRVAMLVANDLTRRGIEAVASPAAGPTVLKMSARVSMQGPAGRMNFDLGSMFEKILAGKSAEELAQVDPAQDAIFGATEYARTAGLTRIGLFNQYLYRYFSAMSVMDALGLHAKVNKALTGDGRGVCLINCDNWKNTHHWVIVDATVVEGGVEKSARAVLKAWMSEIDPQTTFDIAYQTLLTERLLKAAP